MATTTALRPDTPGPTGAPDAPVIADRDLASFRAGRSPEERLVDLVAFALAAEKRQSPTQDTIERLRQEASAALSDHAFRYLHNSMEDIRQEAVRDRLGMLRQPPRFGTLLLANLLALVIAGLAASWLILHPATLAGLAGLLSG